MSTTPIFLLAPAPGMTFVAMPSGAAYVADGNGLIVVTNGSVADQLALIAAGCATLEPNAGGNVTVQTGTSYTVQPTDNGANIVFANASPITVTLPNTSPVGFAVSLYQGGAGQITAQAASGGSVVTPNVGTTPGQYCALTCLCIANATGANAQWDVIAEPSVTGGGLVGASTLASLYTQDTSAHYAQYSVAQVFSDGTTTNNGFWLKTGTGNGAGNWTQQSTITLASLSAGIVAETTRAEVIEAAILAGSAVPIFPDDVAASGIIAGFVDAGGSPVLASLTSNIVVGLVGQQLVITPIFPDDAIAGGLVDSSGGILLAVSATGAAIPSQVIPPFPISVTPIFPDDNLSEATVDSSGGILEGRTSSGNQPMAGTTVYLGGDGNVHAVSRATDFKVASALGTIRTVLQAGASIRWVDEWNSAREPRVFSVNGGAAIAVNSPSVTHIVFLPQIGQSLSMGQNGIPLVTTSPVAPTKVFMFNGGTRPQQQQDSALAQPGSLLMCHDDALEYLTPLREQYCPGNQSVGETQGGGVGWWLAQSTHLAANEAVVFATFGVGGAHIAQMTVGSPSQTPGNNNITANVIRTVERITAICSANGWTLEVPCILFDQGESDASTSASVYTTAFQALQSGLTAAINTITGGAGQIPILFRETSGWTEFGVATDPVVYAKLALAIANPTKFIYAGPQYSHADYSPEGIHLQGTGYRTEGEYFGRAVQKLRASAAIPNLYAVAVSNSGTTLTATFNAATQLVLDTTLVSNPGQYGLRLLDQSGSPVVLTSIAISGTNQIVAALPGALTAGNTYTFCVADVGTIGNAAGATTGPRSNLRDSSADIGSNGANLYNWAASQQLMFTAS
jgi:hypothetical protein